MGQSGRSAGCRSPPTRPKRPAASPYAPPASKRASWSCSGARPLVGGSPRIVVGQSGRSAGLIICARPPAGGRAGYPAGLSPCRERSLRGLLNPTHPPLKRSLRGLSNAAAPSAARGLTARTLAREMPPSSVPRPSSGALRRRLNDWTRCPRSDRQRPPDTAFCTKILFWQNAARGS